MKRTTRSHSVDDKEWGDDLIGSWFHSGPSRGWQGQVLAKAEEGLYLVGLMSWVNGLMNDQVLVFSRHMAEEEWVFYDSLSIMNEQYHEKVKHRWERDRRG